MSTWVPDGQAPPSASARSVLRDALPVIMQTDDLAQRFVGALERLLDPIVAICDGLAATFDPALAGEDILDLLAAWLGFEFDERLDEGRRRRLVSQAAALAALQGTRAGLELALELHFPDLPLRVVDHGGVAVGGRHEEEQGEVGVTVLCDQPVTQDTGTAIAGVMREFTPAHVPSRLVVGGAAAG